jgi:glycosyltransferase involved in cell wall biosynthesis
MSARGAPAAVTVVIPTRNRLALLRTTLLTALHQEGVDVRVVVVDDASEDGTGPWLAALDSPRVTVLRHEARKGVSAARNAGLEQVETPWVAFLDDDDVWAPDHLARLLRAVARSPGGGDGVDLAAAGNLVTDLRRRVLHVQRSPVAPELREHLLVRNVLGTPSRVLLRADAVRRAGGFDGAFSVLADWDLWLRVVRPGNVVVTDDLTVGYTWHDANMHVVAPLLIAELPRLQARHRHPGAADLLDSSATYIAWSYRQSGERLRASRWYLRSWRAGNGARNLARAAGVLLGEPAMRRLAGRTRADPGLGRWLASVAALDRLPLDAPLAEAAAVLTPAAR